MKINNYTSYINELNYNAALNEALKYAERDENGNYVRLNDDNNAQPQNAVTRRPYRNFGHCVSLNELYESTIAYRTATRQRNLIEGYPNENENNQGIVIHKITVVNPQILYENNGKHFELYNPTYGEVMNLIYTSFRNLFGTKKDPANNTDDSNYIYINFTNIEYPVFKRYDYKFKKVTQLKKDVELRLSNHCGNVNNVSKVGKHDAWSFISNKINDSTNKEIIDIIKSKGGDLYEYGKREFFIPNMSTGAESDIDGMHEQGVVKKINDKEYSFTNYHKLDANTKFLIGDFINYIMKRAAPATSKTLTNSNEKSNYSYNFALK